ncbi:hypothetical protein F5146DRAFT_948012 [Armillaria mellea]|nr:hypothetical protein F5146DRAFT_948012 [Armillaria mellea]
MSSSEEIKAGIIYQALDGYLNSLCIESLTYGLYTAVLLSGLSKMLFNRRGRNRLFMAVIIAVLYSFETVHLGVRWYRVRQAFIVNGDSRTAIFESFLNPDYQWMWVVNGVFASFNILIADCVLIWRAWVVWDRNYKIVVVPMIGAILEIIFDGFFLYQDISHTSSTSLSNWGPDAVNWGIAYFTMSLITTVLSTCLVVFRIATIQRSATHAVSLLSYRGVIEIVIESAALYAVSLIVFLAFFTRDDPRSGYPQAILNTVTGIAPTLIAARVASGRARPDEGWATNSSLVPNTSYFSRRSRGNYSISLPLNRVGRAGNAAINKGGTGNPARNTG